MKVFQFYVHCFLRLLLKYQYPAWPPFFCITFLSRCGMERAGSLRLASGMFRQACRNLDFSPPIVSGIGSLYATSSIMLHRFSMELRSGEFAGHSSFSMKFGRFFLHHCWVAFAVWAGAPSCTKVALLLFVKSFRSTGSSVVDRRLKRGFTSFSRIFVI